MGLSKTFPAASMASQCKEYNGQMLRCRGSGPVGLSVQTMPFSPVFVEQFETSFVVVSIKLQAD